MKDTGKDIRDRKTRKKTFGHWMILKKEKDI
jgi:hypothetical protein